MNAVDTNVLVYARDPRDPVRRDRAREFIASLEDGVLLWQVACEFLSVTRKLAAYGFTIDVAQRELADLRRTWTTAFPTWEVHDRAVALLGRHSLSVWDALLVAAFLEYGVSTLYSEDFGAVGRIDGLAIINPFAAAPPQPSAP